MRTLEELNKFFDKNKMHRYSDHVNSYIFNVGGEKLKRRKSGWGYYYDPEFKGGYRIGCSVSQATFCCGVSEMGSFQGANAHQKIWEAILEYVIQTEKLQYLRCETLSRKSDFKVLDKALEKVGFRLVVALPSRHNVDLAPDDRYDVKVWEWLEPAKTGE